MKTFNNETAITSFMELSERQQQVYVKIVNGDRLTRSDMYVRQTIEKKCREVLDPQALRIVLDLLAYSPRKKHDSSDSIEKV